MHQVKQYCAAQLNDGKRFDLILGVLSDTVRWHAFCVSEVKDISSVPGATTYGPEHIELAEIDYHAAFLVAMYSPPQVRDEIISKLARVLARNRKFGESAVFWRQALDIRKTLDGHDSQTAVNAQQWATMQARNHIEFNPDHVLFREKLKKFAQLYGPYSRETYSAAVEIARSLIKGGRREESQQYILLAITIKTNPQYRRYSNGY